MHTFMQHSLASFGLRGLIGAALGAALVAGPAQVHGICGLYDGAGEQIRSVKDPKAFAELTRKLTRPNDQFTFGGQSCAVCHLGAVGGPRNAYGNAINTLLTVSSDREDPVRQRDAARRMTDILANPLSPDSPTFGELFQRGQFPAPSLFDDETPLPKVPARESEEITVERARDLVKETESTSPWGILQLSRTYKISPEVAQVLAEFRGEMLILGIQSITPEVAAAIATSKASAVWLHSITSVSQETAEALAKARCHLVMTSLAQLDSVELAEKLAQKPGALSFPYLKKISPPVAAALAKNKRSLTLAGLSEIPLEVQEQLAQTVGALYLPNLKSLDSMPLTRKLATGLLLLPKVEKLSAEQVEIFLQATGIGSFFGGIVLSSTAISPDAAAAIAKSKGQVNLTIICRGPLSDQTLEKLLQSKVNLRLPGLEKLSAKQARVVTDALSGRPTPSGVLAAATVSLPSLKRLDSPLLAEKIPNGLAITSISAEAAAALGRLPSGPDPARPSGELSFPNLESLSPEIARLILARRWLSITLPALEDVSLETIRDMARQTFRLTLGITALPPEFADAFKEMAIDGQMGGGSIVLPQLRELSPDAARILVKSLNRGVQDLGHTRISKSPKLYLGADIASHGAGFNTLSPEVAAELAKYEGILALGGLREISDEAAAAFESFPGPYLILSGPGTLKLSPKAAESLSKVPGVLRLEQLRELDSVPLAARFARQISWTLNNLETVSKEAAPPLSQYKQFFDLRMLTTLDSPEMARRFVEGTTGGSSITLPALTKLTPQTAEILGSGSKPLYLGLTYLDSPSIARSLVKAPRGVNLFRLRAATPQVIEILKQAGESVIVNIPQIEVLYELPNPTSQP